MFDSHEKSTGTNYTSTVMLLTMAFVVSPAMLLFSQPFGYKAVIFAVASSVACLALARLAWTRSSRLSIPSIAAIESTEAK